MGSTKSELVKESNELTTSIRKLKAFIASEKFDHLPDLQRKDLQEQLSHMNASCKVMLRKVGRSSS